MADHTVFKVIVPTEATAGWFGRWLFAPNPVPAHFGRKRRARRARGRRIEARRKPPYVGGRIWLASARSSFRSHPLPKVMMLDEVDSFPTGALTVERWAGAQRLMRSHCADADRFLDPSLGQPWEGTDEADPHRR
jgi:hypothetical protein